MANSPNVKGNFSGGGAGRAESFKSAVYSILLVLIPTLFIAVIFFILSALIFPAFDASTYKISNISFVIGLIIISGGLGGLSYSIYENEGSFILPYIEKKSVCLGSLSEFLIGSTSALGILFFLAGSLKIEESDGIFRLVGLGVIAGLAGTALIPTFRRSVVNQLNNITHELSNVKKTAERSEIKSMIDRAMKFVSLKQYASADEILGEVIDQWPDYQGAYVLLGFIKQTKGLETENEEILDEAYDYYTKAIVLSKETTEKAGAYLQRASLHYLRKNSEDAIRADLEEAYKFDPEIGKYVIEADGHGFQNIQSKGWFQEIVKKKDSNDV